MGLRNHLLATAVAAVVATACANERTSGAGNPISEAVKVSGFAFDPDALRIDVGTAIVWENDDRIAHTVTSGRAEEKGVPGVSGGKEARPDGVFDGLLKDENATFTFIFEEPGPYSYYCAIHPSMRAEVIVE